VDDGDWSFLDPASVVIIGMMNDVDDDEILKTYV